MIEDKRINRIVLYGDCGADYRINLLPGWLRDYDF